MVQIPTYFGGGEFVFCSCFRQNLFWNIGLWSTITQHFGQSSAAFVKHLALLHRDVGLLDIEKKFDRRFQRRAPRLKNFCTHNILLGKRFSYHDSTYPVALFNLICVAISWTSICCPLMLIVD